MAEIELAFRSTGEIDFDHLYFDGNLLEWRKGIDGIRNQFVQQQSGLLVKTEWNGVQGEREWDLWNSLQPEHEEFFQPVYEHGQIKQDGGVLDYIVVPFIKFNTSFVPSEELACRVQADYLADFYKIEDFGPRQYKPVNQGRSFIIHDYGSGQD